MTRYFGELEYDATAIFSFAAGIPGFEDQDRFLFIDQPQNRPLVFMQSLKNRELCFIAVPVFVARPDYRLELAPEDLDAISLPPDRTPRIGEDVLCLGLVSITQDAGPTVDLAAPVVLNLATRKGVQAIRPDAAYSYQHPLLGHEEVSPCS